MDEVFRKISNGTLYRVQDSLCSIYIELKEILGEERFSNEVYINILWLSNLIDAEYFRRERITKEEAINHNLDYDYSNKLDQE